MRNVSRDFNEDIFSEIIKIWAVTGVGKPERGDDLHQVIKTLNSDGLILTVYEKDKCTGTCWITSDSRRLYLHHMAVLPEYQNKGFGNALMEEACKYAAEMQMQMKLEVDEQNCSAVHLYRKHGFGPLEHYRTMIRRDY